LEHAVNIVEDKLASPASALRKGYPMRLLVLFSLLSCTLLAQDRAAITGTLTDPSGSIVPSAEVEVKSSATGFRRSVMTDSNGVYAIPALAVGAYDITITKSGFTRAAVDHIDLQYGETRTIDVRLEVQSTVDTVDIAATAEAVNRTNAEIGGVI